LVDIEYSVKELEQQAPYIMAVWRLLNK